MNKTVYNNYLELSNKIVSSCKRNNIKDIKINKANNKVEVIYNNDNIKVIIKDCLTTNKNKKLEGYANIITKTEDIKDKRIGIWAIIIFLIIGYINIQLLWILFLIFFFSLAIPSLFVIFWMIIASIVIILNFIYEIIVMIIIYLGNNMLRLFSLIIEKIFKKDYVNLFLFRLWNIYEIDFMKKILIKNINKNSGNTKIDYNNYLFPEYLFDTSKISLLYKDGSKINLDKNIEKITKYRIWKEIFKITLTLDKFYDVYNNIQPIIELEKEELKQKFLNKKIIVDDNTTTEILRLEKKYKTYVEETNELNEIIKTTRKIYWQPKDTKIFDKIDLLLESLKKETKELNILNKKLKKENKKVKKIDVLLEQLKLEKSCSNSKSNKLKLERLHFKVLIWLNKKVCPYIKRKIIEIDKKIKNEINWLCVESKDIEVKILSDKNKEAERIRELLDNAGKKLEEINKLKNKISELRKSLEV